MDRSPILFRCDGNPSAGYEGLYLSLTFAAALQRRRRLCHLMGDVEPFPLIAQVARAGNEYLTAGAPAGTPEDCDEMCRAVRRVGAAGVVLRGGQAPPDYVTQLAATGATVIVMDAEGDAGVYHSRLNFNMRLGAALKSYAWKPGSQFCLGARYALVRSVFRRQRTIRTGEPQGGFRVFAAFGDDDAGGQSLVRAEELLGNSRLDKISLFARSHHRQIVALRGLAERHKGRLEVLTEPSELGTRLQRAHFAVTGGDAWSMEVACVGIPQLLIPQCARHAQSAKVMDAAGAATDLGSPAEATPLAFREAVRVLLDDPRERIGMARAARRLIDGRGADRMVTALEVMLHPSAGAARQAAA